MARGKKKIGAPTLPKAEAYRHPEAESLLRPEVGTQPQFKKKKPPQKYRYDSSLSPALDWDGQNPARELAEWLIGLIEEAAALPAPHLFDKPRETRRGNGQVVATVRGLQDAVDQLKRLSQPFLNWAGKAERLSFEVPTLPLFIHERLSTKAIIETLKGHRKPQERQMDLFGDPQHPVIDQVLKAYEYRDKWVNRLILGNSLVVMNSLLHYEGLSGQVHMIYLDPPYGISFGSNFQPFVRKRDVKHNDDEDMTREPEMVKAYRDTWKLGVHSYLSYMQDQLLLCRDLLEPSGSIFVQISDENLHHIREVMDTIFGVENFCGLIAFRKTGGQSTSLLSTSTDFLLWYAKDKERAKNKFHNPTFPKRGGTDDGSGQYTYIEPTDFSQDPRSMTKQELEGSLPIPDGWRILAHDTLYSQGAPSDPEEIYFEWRSRVFKCPPNTHWKPGVKSGGMSRLASANRLMLVGSTLRYKRYVEDFPVYLIDNIWNDTAISGFGRKKEYVVETSFKVIERCILMTTNPGDLVLDPTCGSGTTAYVAEQWGRRWITIDVSRVPLALARQRLLTATFPYYELKEETRGPASGFVYLRKQNKQGEEVGGIVPHVTLKSIANNEPPEEEVLVDRPEVVKKVTRVTGPFCVEATIPAPMDWEGEPAEDAPVGGEDLSFMDRILEVLRQSPVLHLGGGKTVTLKNIRPPAKTLSLSAVAVVADPQGKPGEQEQPDREMVTTLTSSLLAGGREAAVALVFGPENGAVSEKLVYEAAREAHAKGYAHLYVIGFAIQPNARKLVDECDAVMDIGATYVQATPDLMMGDLLKNMRSSQIFSVCGLPEVKLRQVQPKDKNEPINFQAELLGLDVFDPVTMETMHLNGDDVPAWFLDTDYNGLCFHVCQAFFPRTEAWDNLKKALKGLYEETVWDHLAGTVSAPFEAGETGQVAVKVIDDRGNELMVVKGLKEAEK
jgi:adenine-specific DNA-methyltransferase